MENKSTALHCTALHCTARLLCAGAIGKLPGTANELFSPLWGRNKGFVVLSTGLIVEAKWIYFP
jgi:hypothetical protein